ncbi:MAG: carbohydrate-binding domain-containing protein [Oscillospiraceae bacterium]|nr:carbohydrate-binding domain-containing protein [Oscillospiraceae bacterium]
MTAAGGANEAGIGGGNGGSGSVTISGGYITASGYAPIGSGADGAEASVNIIGGYFGEYTDETTVYGVDLADGYGAYQNTDSATSTEYPCFVTSTTAAFIATGGRYTYSGNVLNITGGGTYTISMNTYANITKTSTDTIKITSSDDVTITLVGLNISNSSSAPFEIDAAGDVTLILSGANTFDASSGDDYAGLQKTSTGNTLTVTCETDDSTDSLTAKGGYYAAGIGGGYNSAGENITINGGTVTTIGGYYGAGIGGGTNGTGIGGGSYITINGGTISATGGNYAAGIGGGGSSSGSYIKITGGIINAAGNRGGAGIGGGSSGQGNDIEISGGTVTAAGGVENSYSGAGIGGGDYASASGITISGGYVTASSGISGSYCAAAIGGGSDSAGTDINITGGYIIASTTSGYADIIGSGYNGGTADVTITGGHYPADSCTTGEYGTGKVYSLDIADGYTVYDSKETETADTYPYQVAASNITLTYAKPDGVEGTQPASESYSYGDPVTVSTTLPYTKDGYTQTGWSTSKTDSAVGTSPAVSSFTILDSTTLYPVFERTFTDSNLSTDIALTYNEEIETIYLKDYLKFVDNATFTTTDGQFTFGKLSGTLPDGLTFDEENGKITGTPTEAGTFEVSFTVTDKTPYITLFSLDSTPAALTATLTLTFTVSGVSDLVVNGGDYTGCSFSDNVLTISESGTYTITMADDTDTTTDTIVVDTDGDVIIYLDGVSIESSDVPAIEVTGGGSVTLILVGENTLTVTDESTSGVTVTSGSLEITGTGGLTTDAISGENITVTGGSYSDSSVVADLIADNYSSHTDSTSETYDCVVVSDSQELVVTGGVEYTYENGVLTITGGGDYTISMNEYSNVESTSDTIVIDSDEDVTVTLDDVTIESSTSSPLTVSGDGDVTVVISGDNTLDASGSDSAAIDKTSTDGTLTITSETSTDTLTATGGTNADAASGDNIEISCGTYNTDVSEYTADNYYTVTESGVTAVTRSASTVYDTTEAVNFSVTLDGLYDNLNSADKIDHSEAAEYRVVLENLDTTDNVTSTVLDSIKNTLTGNQSIMTAVDISVKKYVGGVEDTDFDYNSILSDLSTTQTVQITLPSKADSVDVYHIPDTNSGSTTPNDYKVTSTLTSDDSSSYVTFALSSFSGTIIPGTPSLTSGYYADSVYLTLDDGSITNDGEYTLKLCGTDGYDIQNLTAAQLKFAFADGYDITKISALSIDAAYGVSMTYLGNGEYTFTVDGGVTDDEITLGTVKIIGEGTYSLGLNTTSGFANQATVNGTVFPYNATQATGKLYLYGFPVTGSASLSKSNLTVNVMFPNEIGDKATEYTAMQVAYSNALGDYSVALGNDNLTYGTISNTDWYGYTFTVQVPMSYTTSLTFSGDGYCTYDATITPTGAASSVTVWNSVLDSAATVVSANSTDQTTAETVTFLAGDIVADGIISLYDLSAVTSYFGMTLGTAYSKYTQYDLNRDGKIDSKDIAMVLISWGK